MHSSTLLVIAIPLLLVLAAVIVLATGRRQANTGTLSRETRRRDASLTPSVPTAATSGAGAEEQASSEARERVDEARRALGSGSATPAARAATAVAERVAVDDEKLAVTRRQFFNRGILAVMGLALGGFGLSTLAFLWPASAGGFGSKVAVSTGLKAILAQIAAKKEPFYYPEARAYVQRYPKAGLPKAKKVYSPTIYQVMASFGIVALYQKCPHLGCKVPWCDSSQWFECPCHGSKYNAVGEKRGGPAPRGMDRFPVSVSGDSITIDTSIVVLGPPIGTDTTGQSPEGPFCV